MRHKIDALTGLRGYLALWVFGFHAGSFFPASRIFHNRFFEHGYMAVDGFFLLSGFVLFHVHGAEIQKPAWGKIGRFLILRIARIYPVHFLVLAAYAGYLGFLLASHTPLPPERYSAIGLISSLTLTQTWLGYGLTWNIPAWSISTEWALYLAFPLLAFVAAKIPDQPFLILAAAFFAYWILLIGPTHMNLVLRGLPSFLLGMAICKAELWQALLKSGPVARFLSLPVSLFLGEISYSFYMLHFLVLTIVRKFPSGSADLNGLLALAATLALAALSLRYYERPARALLRQASLKAADD